MSNGESSWRVSTGDCIEHLRFEAADSIDTCITDPPYGLSFMGKEWDHGVPGVPFWEKVKRVLKPGAMLLAFGGTRTYHRLACAIEDAGFELRDCLMWLYGSGFPKSLDISKAIDKAAGAARAVVGPSPIHSRGKNAAFPKRPGETSVEESGRVTPQDAPMLTAPATTDAKLWDGWGTALKPAWEPILLAMKPLDGTFAENALARGVAGLNIDGCRVESGGTHGSAKRAGRGKGYANTGGHGTYRGVGGVVSPPHPDGRWPANLILDEETGKLLDAQSGNVGQVGPQLTGDEPSAAETGRVTGSRRRVAQRERHNDSGGASRFFYCAKASRSERTHRGEVDNRHPTVKPVSLMRWLVRLTATPTGGVVLDPFTGSGSTGVACLLEGRVFVGIESDGSYAEIARERLRLTEEDDARHRTE